MLQSPRARIWLCGPLRVELDQRRVESLLPARQGRLLFAYLVLQRPRPIGRDELIEALWPQGGPANPQAVLNTLVARLRAALGAGRIAGRSELSLVLGADPWIDVEAARAALAAARAALQGGRPADALFNAEEALKIVEQPLLRDLDRPWLDDHRRRLDALHPALLTAVGQAALALGGTALGRGTEAARELAALEPFRESTRDLLMRLHASSGDIAEAIRVYDNLRIHLRDELGTVPSPQLTALHHRLLTAPEDIIPTFACHRSSPPVAVPVSQRSAALAGAPDPQPPRALPRPLQPAVGQLPFTGRERQLAYLTKSWADVDLGARRVAVLSGEAGIGKTRVAAELAASVRAEGCLVLYGRCDAGLAVPYQPFVEALRTLLPTFDVDELRSRLGGLAPELGRLLPELTELGAPAPAYTESARLALFEAVVALLELATAQRRTLLVIDDVHWAAPATLLLLRHVIRSERQLALLIVVTFRSTELQPDEPLAELLADLQRDNSVHRIALRGLDEQAIDTLMRAAVGPALADRAGQLAPRVHAETAGNPFFVRELLADLLESDALSATNEGPASALPGPLAIPEGLRSVICHRVARLSQPARQVMTLTSVAAGTIEASLLEALLGHSSPVLDALDETVAAGLLVEAGRGFDFAHALVRQAVYESLTTARRLRLHRRLGEAIEARGDTHDHVEALAHHFAQLALDGESDKAVTYAIAAGHAAAARLAYEDAAAHFQHGLDVLAQTQEPQGRRHIDLLLGLGHAGWSTGDSGKARHAFQQAADIALSIADATAAADAALGFSGPPFFEVGTALRPSTAVLLQRALGMLDDHDSALRARLMGRLAAARAYAGGHYDHRALAYDALAMARAAQDKHALAEVLATGYWATCGPDDPDGHLRMARELTCLAEEVGDARLLAYGRQWGIGHLLEQGDLNGVRRELGELEQLAAKHNDRFARWLLTAIRAVLASVQGRLAAAESLVLEALQQWGDPPQFAPAAQVFAAQMIPLRREQGRLADLVGRMAAVVEQTPEVPAWRCALIHMYAYLGDHDRAKDELRLLGDLSDLPRNGLWLMSMARVGTAVALLDDHSRSRQAYELLLPHASTCVVALSLVCEGPTSRPLGMLATTLGRYDEAELHFKRALAMSARIRSPLWTSHIQYQYACMLRLRGRLRDRDRAGLLLATATATATKLGFHALGQLTSAEAGLTAMAASSSRD